MIKSVVLYNIAVHQSSIQLLLQILNINQFHPQILITDQFFLQVLIVVMVIINIINSHLSILITLTHRCINLQPLLPIDFRAGIPFLRRQGFDPAKQTPIGEFARGMEIDQWATFHP